MIACNDVSRADIGCASDENAMTVFFAEHYQMQKRDLEKASKQEISQQLVDARGRIDQAKIDYAESLSLLLLNSHQLWPLHEDHQAE